MIALLNSLDDAHSPIKTLELDYHVLKTSSENVFKEFPELFFSQAYNSFDDLTF